jgi:hypothetical protein
MAAAGGAAPKASALLPVVASFLDRCGLVKAAQAVRADAKTYKDGAVRAATRRARLRRGVTAFRNAQVKAPPAGEADLLAAFAMYMAAQPRHVRVRLARAAARRSVACRRLGSLHLEASGN